MYTADNLRKLLIGFDRDESAAKPPGFWNAYKDYTPSRVMPRFCDAFYAPPTCGRLIAAKTQEAHFVPSDGHALDLGASRHLHPGCGWARPSQATPRAQCASASSLAAVRCCGVGYGCVSLCFCAAVNLSVAHEQCAKLNKRLCTRAELRHCCKKGCGYDNTLVWTRNACSESESITLSEVSHTLSHSGPLLEYKQTLRRGLG